MENQTKEMQNFLKRFQEMKEVCDGGFKKYGSLSLKLSVVAGLFFAIILI